MKIPCRICGLSVDDVDNFCRHCGTSLTEHSGSVAADRRLGVSPETAAGLWKNFFGPFFKIAFIFLGCFFGLAILLVIFWHFKFGG